MTAAFRDKNTFLLTRSVLRCPPKAAPATPGDSLSIRKSSPGRTRHQTEGGATSIVACLRLCFWESHEPPFWSRISMTAALRATAGFLSTRSALRCPPKVAPATPGDSLSVRKLRSAPENHGLAPPMEFEIVTHLWDIDVPYRLPSGPRMGQYFVMWLGYPF